MTELEKPPEAGPPKAKELSPAEQYADILGRMCLIENRTDAFDSSGLAGRRMIGFYSLLKENGQLSIGVYHTNFKGSEDVKLQPLDIHAGWQPFVPEVIASLKEWALRAPWEQTQAKEAAEAGGIVPPLTQAAGKAGIADVILVDFGKGAWENRGPYWRPPFQN